jgi:hypothetical protein
LSGVATNLGFGVAYEDGSYWPHWWSDNSAGGYGSLIPNSSTWKIGSVTIASRKVQAIYAQLVSYETISNASDRRLKEDITDAIGDYLGDIKSFRLRNYSWIHDTDRVKQLGVIAQEVQETTPEYVDARDESHLGVRLDRLTYALVGAVQQLSNKVEMLENRLAAAGIP